MRPGARLREALPPFESIPIETIGLFLDEYRREIPARERSTGSPEPRERAGADVTRMKRVAFDPHAL